MQVLHQIYPNASNLSRLTLWSLLRRNKHKKCVILFVTLFNLDYSCQLLNSKKLIETELWRGKRVNYPIKHHRTLTKTLLSTTFLLLQLKLNTTFFLHSSKEVYFSANTPQAETSLQRLSVLLLHQPKDTLQIHEGTARHCQSV